MKIRSIYSLSLFSAIVLSIFFLQSCGKRTQVVTFFFFYNQPNTVINYSPIIPGSTEVTIYTGKFKIPLDSLLRTKNCSHGKIEQALLKKLAIVMTGPTDSTLNWISSARIIACSDSSFTQPFPCTSYSRIDLKNKTIDLEGGGYYDLTSLIQNESYFLKVLATPNGKVSPYPVKLYLSSMVQLMVEPLP
jgi:hypothetical protein